MRAKLTFILAAAVSCYVFGSCLAKSKAGDAALFETFGPGWTARWHYSGVKKYQGRFQVVKPPGFQDTAIKMADANKHYGMTALLDKPLQPSDGLVVQYEVKFSEGHKCGGAYLKLLSAPADGTRIDPQTLKGKTPFTIMFGPDRCGPDARVHVILHIHNPVSGHISEHHLMSAPAPKEDLLSHVYALLLHTNGRYKVLIDGLEAAAGQLLTADFKPPLQPPEAIPDPEHIKPEDWLEEEMMDDPRAVKPKGWDDRRMVADPHALKPEGWLDQEVPEVPDPDAVKPGDWDEATLGVWLPPPVNNPACVGAPGCGPWKAPLVKNPKYKGPWIPPQVKNPAYKGSWQQRMIPNPGYFKVDNPLDLLPPVAGVAFELWTTEAGYIFDSVLLGSGDAGIAAAASYMKDTWRRRNLAEMSAYLAEERSKSRPPGVRHVASNALRDVLEHRVLAGVRPHLGSLLWLLHEVPEAGWVLLLVPTVALAALVMDRLTRSKEADADADDVEPEPEVEVDQEEAKRLSKQAAALQKQRQATAGAGPAAQATQQRQQEQETQEEQQQEQQGRAGSPAPHAEAGDTSPAATPQPRRRALSKRA